MIESFRSGHDQPKMDGKKDHTTSQVKPSLQPSIYKLYQMPSLIRFSFGVNSGLSRLGATGKVCLESVRHLELARFVFRSQAIFSHYRAIRFFSVVFCADASTHDRIRGLRKCYDSLGKSQ